MLRRFCVFLKPFIKVRAYRCLSKSAFKQNYNEDFDIAKGHAAAAVRNQSPIIAKGENYKENITHVATTNFYSLCQQLKQGTSVGTIQPAKLAYLPINALTCKQAEFFVDEIVPLWWQAIKLRLREIWVSDLIKGTLNAWRLFNNRFKDDRLLKSLGDEAIMNVTYYVHLRLPHISPKNFYYVLSSLNSFNPYASPDLKSKLKEKVSRMFPQYLNAAYSGKVGYYEHLLNNIGLLSFELKEFGCDRPDDVCLKQLVKIFLHVFEANVPCAGQTISFDYFMTLDRIAVVLLHWNIDAGKFEENFWAKWYERSFEFYRILRDSYDVFRALYLLHCLMVCLKFDQEKEFSKMADFWIQEFVVCKHILKPEQIPLEEVKKKYSDSTYLSENGFDRRTLDKIIDLLLSSKNS